MTRYDFRYVSRRPHHPNQFSNYLILLFTTISPCFPSTILATNRPLSWQNSRQYFLKQKSAAVPAVRKEPLEDMWEMSLDQCLP